MTTATQYTASELRTMLAQAEQIEKAQFEAQNEREQLEKSIIKAYSLAQKRECKKSVVARVNTFEALCRALKSELTENPSVYSDYRAILPSEISVARMLSVHSDDGMPFYLVCKKRKNGKYPLFGANWDFAPAKRSYEGVVASLRSFAQMVEQAAKAELPPFVKPYQFVRETINSFSSDILGEL